MVLLAVICSVIFFPGAARPEVFTKKTAVMGTDLETTLVASTEAEAQAAFASVESEMKRLEGLLSEWLDGSPVSEVNRNAGRRPVAVPRELFSVISAALQVSELSGGAFDITWASMRGLWDFRPGHERVPTAEEVRAKIGLVDYRQVALDAERSTVFLKKKGMAIGLGGIAKGYSVDRAMQSLASSGITDAIVKAGGDTRVQGRAPGASGWEVGIQDPRDREKLMATLTLSSVSISTSGDYERFFIKDGRLYHHIMDPSTGFPATGSRSVTILGPDTMTTDALSTAVFVLGPRKGMELVERLQGVEAVIVAADGGVTASQGVATGRLLPLKRP